MSTPLQQQNKEEWIRSAMEKYEGQLMNYAFSFTRDIDRARDIVQDTFLKLCSQEPGKIDEYLSKWLFTVCRNRALDVLKKENRMQPLSDIQLEHQADESATPSEIVDRNELAGKAMKVFEKLAPNQQEVLRLKFQHGLSYKEISEITQLSVTNVGFLIHTGIKAIRDKLPTELKNMICDA